MSDERQFDRTSGVQTDTVSLWLRTKHVFRVAAFLSDNRIFTETFDLDNLNTAVTET